MLGLLDIFSAKKAWMWPTYVDNLYFKTVYRHLREAGLKFRLGLTSHHEKVIQNHALLSMM